MIQARFFGDFYGKEQSRRRFWIGMWLSLGLHAFVLSLQFGVPGLGLPGLERSRSEQPSQNTDLQVTLALPAPGVTGTAPPSLPAMPAPLTPSPPVSGHSSLESRVNPPMPAASSRLQLVDPRPTAPVLPVPSPVHALGKIAKGTKAGSKLKSRVAAKPASKRRQTPHVIARSSDGDSTFNMPAPSPEQQGEQANTSGLAEPAAVGQEERTARIAMSEPVEQNAETGDEDETQYEAHQRTEEAIALQRQQKEREAFAQAEREMARQQEELRRQAEAQQATQLAAAQEAKQRQQAQQQEQEQRALEDAPRRQQEAQRQADELARRQLAEQENQRRQQEAAQQEAQQAARLAEMQREEERRRQEEMRIARQRHEDYLAQAAQAEQAAQLARQQAEEARGRAEAQVRQRQAEELAARQRTEEQAARQKMQAEAETKSRADAQAQAQAQAQAATAHKREQDRIALAERDDGLNGSGNRRNEAIGAAGGLPRNLPGAGDLASRALELARRPELPRLESQASRPAPEGAAPSRRRSILGNAPQDVGLAMYVDGWRLKIERTGRLNYTQSAVDRSLVDAIVTVMIRSDGGVEEILFNRSSGRPELDEAIRRIIRINAKYASFPPDLARRFDVIEIRRIWNFEDNKLKVMEEVKF